VLANADPDDFRFSISFDLVLTAPRCGEGDGMAEASATAEYLAPHPSDWQEVP
jgi:hypothetical protein